MAPNAAAPIAYVDHARGGKARSADDLIGIDGSPSRQRFSSPAGQARSGPTIAVLGRTAMSSYDARVAFRSAGPAPTSFLPSCLISPAVRCRADKTGIATLLLGRSRAPPPLPPNHGAATRSHGADTIRLTSYCAPHRLATQRRAGTRSRFFPP